MLIPARISQKQIQLHTSQDSATQSYIARKLATCLAQLLHGNNNDR